LPVSQLGRVVVVGQGEAEGAGQLVGALVHVQKPQLGDGPVGEPGVRVSVGHLKEKKTGEINVMIFLKII
jgi:hypothetical protein